MALSGLLLALALAVVMPVYCQVNTPCSPSMVTSFTPCLNFITNSTTNASSTPTSDCCNSLRSITSRGTDCLCLIATGGVPFQIPINRTLAISLPRACRMPSVPLQCKAPAAAPIPAPGPAALGPALSPTSSSASPPASTVPTTVSPTLAPESDTTPSLTPPSTTTDSGVPATNPGSRPVLTPSAASPTYAVSPFVVAVFGATLIKHFWSSLE